MKQKTLTTRELASRWGMSIQTLKNWRTAGRGPSYLKVGKSVRYQLEVIEKFEAKSQVKTAKKIS